MRSLVSYKDSSSDEEDHDVYSTAGLPPQFAFPLHPSSIPIVSAVKSSTFATRRIKLPMLDDEQKSLGSSSSSSSEEDEYYPNDEDQPKMSLIQPQSKRLYHDEDEDDWTTSTDMIQPSFSIVQHQALQIATRRIPDHEHAAVPPAKRINGNLIEQEILKQVFTTGMTGNMEDVEEISSKEIQAETRKHQEKGVTANLSKAAVVSSRNNQITRLAQIATKAKQSAS